MRFRVLGPLEVWSGGDWTDISADKWRVLLACLVLKAGQIVPTKTLISELWGETPPPTANNLISIYVVQLRRVIGDADGHFIVYHKPGYQLKVDADDTDLQQFEYLMAAGRDALAGGDAEAAVNLLREAEGLWRGGFLADVPASPLVAAESERAVELRVSAAELRIEASLQCGRDREVIPELRRLVAQYPLRERLWLLLMRSLLGAGRQAESLDAYGHARAVIAEKLGVEPGPELQQMYAELLAADTGPPSPSRSDLPPDEAQGMPRPAQLPADIPDFTGRGTEVSYLRDTLSGPDLAGGPGTVRIAVVVGTAGLGKTALAVHTAHDVGDLFPDGQLYANLSGTSDEPAAPGEVLARFLRDLGVDGEKIPVGDEERAALYRTRLTGRRVLILLDDGKDAAQVQPLLPGSASCAVLVTTRNRTPYLVSTGVVDLDTLPEPEVLELFSKIVGDARPAAEPEATAEILRACAGLPLAVRVCAARLATRRHWRVATMAARLRDERRRLDELQVGDLEVRASFQVSYGSLHPTGGRRVAPAHAFRLLGLWQGERISLPAAAALIGERDEDVAGALETLVDANLLGSPEPDWYQFHDLLRLFATERAQAEEPEEVRRAAVARLLRWYLRMAETAADVIAPHRYRIPLDEPDEPSPLVSSVTAALAWYDSERAGVIAATRQAVTAGLHDIAWRLPNALFPLFNRRASWADCITVSRIAVGSADATGQRQARAWSLQNLGQALGVLEDEESLVCLEEALAIRCEIGDNIGEAQTEISLAATYYRLRGPEKAFQHSLRSLEILRRMQNPGLLGVALINHGEFCLELGSLDEAASCSKEALEIWTAIGGIGRGFAMQNLGRIHLESGRVNEAIACLVEAHHMHTATGTVRGQAEALKYLAEAQRRAGLQDGARESLTAALALFKTLKADSDVEAIHSALAVLA
jgi:DNA-binding SARP family transcriptional activator/tetratricopeptide (TPR) repeat protein